MPKRTTTWGSCTCSEGATAARSKEFEEAIRLAPAKLNAHVNLAGALERAGDLERAAQQLRRALELSPGTTVLRESLDRVEGMLERKER